MTQATDKEQTILDRIRNLSLQQQQEVLDFIEFLQFKARKPEIIDQEITQEWQQVQEIMTQATKSPFYTRMKARGLL